MPGIQDLINQLPVDKIAGMLGVDAATAQQGTGAAVAALVHGMRANAADTAGAASLSEALAQHAGRVAAGTVPADPADVDVADGAKIVNHVFGGNSDAVAQQLGGLGGGSDMFKKLLPMLAPLVMAFLAKKVVSGGSSSTAGSSSGGGLSAGGGILAKLKDVFGKLRGQQSTAPPAASAATAAPAATAGGLGDVLGGLLGGGGGGIGDVLGGLLGGGRR